MFQIAIQEVIPTNLETFFDNLGGELINAIAVGIEENVIDDTTLVRWRAVLTQVLNTPVTELTMSNKVDASNNLFNGGTLSIVRV